MKILTLTLSPAFDVHCSLPSFVAGKENLVLSSERGIGGKGINISRALTENGIPNRALVVLGNENADDFIRGMDVCGLQDRLLLRVGGRIRENITIHSDEGEETRISFRGFEADASLLAQVYEMIAPDADTVVTFTGSLPTGISPSEAEAFLTKLQHVGVKLVIDSKSFPFDALLRLHPWLIKPNDEEIAAYTGAAELDSYIKAARDMHASGIENALISLGEDGAVLVCTEGAYLAKPPKIAARSTVGAGDSMIAGFIAASGDAKTKLRNAVAYGSAACLREGTNPPTADDISEIFDRIIITEI